MHAHGDALRRIASASGWPLSETLQVARQLSRDGLYVRPGPGRHRARIPIDLSSLVNVALGLAVYRGLTHAAENVRLLRALVPQDSDAHLLNQLTGEYYVAERRKWWILPGANLGQAFEGLVDGIAKDAEPDIDIYRRGGLQIAILAERVPLASVRLPFRADRQGELPPFVSTDYFPAQTTLETPALRGLGRPGVIRFALIEALADIWREVIEKDRILADGQLPPARVDAATTLPGVMAANPEVVLRASSTDTPNIRDARESEKISS